MLDRVKKFIKEEPETPTLSYNIHVGAVIASWILSPFLTILLQSPAYFLQIFTRYDIFISSYLRSIWIFVIFGAALAIPKIRSYAEMKPLNIFLIYTIINMCFFGISVYQFQPQILGFTILIGMMISGVSSPALYYFSLWAAGFRNSHHYAETSSSNAMSFASHAITFGLAYILPTAMIASVMMPFTMGYSVLLAMIAMKGTWYQFLIIIGTLTFEKVRHFFENHILIGLALFFIVGFTAPLIYFPETTINFFLSENTKKLTGLFKSSLWAGLYATFIGAIYIFAIQYRLRNSVAKFNSQ